MSAEREAQPKRDRRRERAERSERTRQERTKAQRGRATPPPTTPLLAGYRKPGLGRGWMIAFHLALTAIWLAWGYFFGVTAPYQIMPMVAPLPVLALLIIWTLPAGEYAPTRAIEPLFIACLVALVLWPNYIAIALPNMPWITMIRLFVMPLVLVLLICISVSATFRAKLASVLNLYPVIWRMLAAFVFLQTISIFLSDRPSYSINNYLVDQLNHTLIFLVACYVFLTPGFAERWATAFLILAYIVCGVGLWEATLGTLPWSGNVPSFLKIDTAFVSSVVEGAQRATIGAHRVQAMSSQPLVMAELLGLAAPFALHIAINRYPVLLRVLGLAYIPVALGLIELADSRLGNVALLAAVLFYFLIWTSLKWQQNKQSLIAPALVMLYPAVMGVVFFASFIVRPLRVAVWGDGSQQSSTDARGVQWDMAIPKILDAPLGTGIGRAARTLGYVNPAGRGTIDSHYLVVLLDFGPLGFLLFYGLFAYAAWIAARVVIYFRPKGEIMLLLPLMVAMVQFLIIKSVLSLDANHPLLFMMLGAIVALAYRAHQTTKNATPKLA